MEHWHDYTPPEDREPIPKSKRSLWKIAGLSIVWSLIIVAVMCAIAWFVQHPEPEPEPTKTQICVDSTIDVTRHNVNIKGTWLETKQQTFKCNEWVIVSN